jgi:hypothetical protein
MSPLRYYDDSEFDYNVADQRQVRLSYSCGSALYAVRSDLTSLHAWSDEPRHVGSQFIGVFGRLHHSLCRARSNREAAARLRKELIDQLGSCGFEDTLECDLRDSLVSSLRTEDGSPVHDPFRIIFKYVTEPARRLYGADWPGKARCCYEVIGNQPFPGSRFWINAYTDLDLDDPTMPPSVRLRINPNQLNAETYSAIYAILVHECFCHVPAYRAKQTNESPFSEGFCDWAAHQLFGRWLRDLEPSLEDAARKFGEEIWTLMMTKGGGNKFWYARSVGHEAANHLVRMFMDDGATDQEAIDLVITLARQLVVVQDELIRKDSFVRDLGPQPIEPRLRARLGEWRDGSADAGSVLYTWPR